MPFCLLCQYQNYYLCMDNLDTVDGKTNFIISIFKHHQPDLTLIEQIALLTMWEEHCVIKEEYEMANVIKKQLNKIKLNPHNVPQKINLSKDVINNPPEDFKLNWSHKVLYWFKGLFTRKN